jgi:hypothetical protein
VCNFWSCVLLRDGKILWSPKDSSHEAILAEHGISDDKLKDRDFVRLEVAPKDIFSRKKADWVFKVDEPGTLPAWYSDSPKKWGALVWKEWRKAMTETLWKLDLSAVEKVIQEVKHVGYFDMHGEVDPEWHMSYGETWGAAGVAAGAAAGGAAWVAAGAAARDAAWTAAGDAARDAAWTAAGDAAGGAAWVAAGAAARDAAWTAAGDAAWTAAGDAAWAAARDAAWAAAGDAALYVRILLVPSINEKHRKHAEARMDVWRRGYGLYCDVNGKLYVYGVKKEV